MKKFRDPKTETVFEDIETAMEYFCYESLRQCDNCTFYNKNCGKNWVHDHPTEAARLMGYEVIDDSATEIDDTPLTLDDAPTVSGDTPTKEDDMNKQDKPRLAEVLGVKVGEKFRVLRNGIEYACVIGQDGAPEGTAWEVIYAINHPESIVRVPSLTEPELGICRAMGAKWVSRDDGILGEENVELWREKPRKICSIYTEKKSGSRIAIVKSSLFPSVKPGDCIEVEGT